MWWTRPTFRLHLHRLRDHLPNTHCADNKPSRKLAIFSLLGVRILPSSEHVTTQRLLTLIRSEPGAIRVFPYQVLFPYNNSAPNCLIQCSTFGYPAAGMENGDECCEFYWNGTFTTSLT